MNNLVIKSDNLERIRMLVELLGNIAGKACHAADDSEDLKDGALISPAQFLALSEALDECDKLPELDDPYVRDGWLRALDELRILLTYPSDRFLIQPPAGFALVPIVATQAMIEKGVAAAVGLGNSEPWGPHFWRAALREAKRANIEFCGASISYTDGEINEKTMATLGQWPSFEAQSWACKVVHAVIAHVEEVNPIFSQQYDVFANALKNGVLDGYGYSRGQWLDMMHVVAAKAPKAPPAPIESSSLALRIAQAVAEDERGDGCDLSAGMFGPAMSRLIREIEATQKA